MYRSYVCAATNDVAISSVSTSINAFFIVSPSSVWGWYDIFKGDWFSLAFCHMIGPKIYFDRVFLVKYRITFAIGKLHNDDCCELTIVSVWYEIPDEFLSCKPCIVCDLPNIAKKVVALASKDDVSCSLVAFRDLEWREDDDILV